MKKMLLYATLLAVVLTGCSKSMEEIDPALPVVSESLPMLTATAEDDTTRTYLDTDKSVRWHAGDSFSAFVGVTTNRKYEFQGETGDVTGQFTSPEEELEDYNGQPLNAIYGLYPYDGMATISSEGLFTFEMPALQHYRENSFGVTANTMLAVSENVEDTSLRFRNAGGYLKLKLYAEVEGVVVRTVTVRGNNNEKIAGAATATIAYDKAPVVTMAEEATTAVSVACGEGVTLSTDKENPTIFWVVLPAVEFADGITILLTDTEGNLFTKGTRNSLSVVRNEISPMAALKVDYTTPATTVIYYTTNNKKVLEPNTSATAPFGEAVLLSNEYDVEADRGVMLFDRPLTMLGDDAFRSRSELTSMTLPATVTTIGNRAFQYGYGLTSIVLSESLLSIGNNAFDNCYELDAITLPEELQTIGERAFYRCDDLVEITFPAAITSLPNYVCYGCSMLERVVLSEQTTAIGDNAFQSCSKLSEIELPASLKSIGQSGFADCKLLPNITFPEALESLGNYAFDDC